MMTVANSYSGASNIVGGTLSVNHPLALQNSTVNVAGQQRIGLQ